MSRVNIDHATPLKQLITNSASCRKQRGIMPDKVCDSLTNPQNKTSYIAKNYLRHTYEYLHSVCCCFNVRRIKKLIANADECILRMI